MTEIQGKFSKENVRFKGKNEWSSEVLPRFYKRNRHRRFEKLSLDPVSTDCGAVPVRACCIQIAVRMEDIGFRCGNSFPVSEYALSEHEVEKILEGMLR